MKKKLEYALIVILVIFLGAMFLWRQQGANDIIDQHKGASVSAEKSTDIKEINGVRLD